MRRCDDDSHNVNKQLIDVYVFCEIDEQEADRPAFLEESQQVKNRKLTLDNLTVLSVNPNPPHQHTSTYVDNRPNWPDCYCTTLEC